MRSDLKTDGNASEHTRRVGSPTSDLPAHFRECSINSRTNALSVLETRVLAGLERRIMAPEILADAMQTFLEENN
ncbi:hypothetical protein ACFQ3K_12480 [Brucella gallinifaecis]|uniref:hypothetical protein n=1 Tax=Brucella gallinifaecis TaxID=215590 RepID=UPI001AEEDDBB|nr:hypothetical protein [Brucella gallinifaecis]